jgi:hypothetical protein
MRRFACFVICVLASVLPGHFAAAQQTSTPTGPGLESFRQGVDIGDVILIVDFSGSMGQVVDGRPKYVAAGDAAQELLDQLAKPAPGLPVQSVGLMLYGHRSRQKCSDIELAVPPAPLSDPEQRNRIMQRVRDAKPLGMTPIATSLAMAAEKLHYRDRPATVVLVSDGVETCHLDPCAEAKQLHDEAVHFIVHIVGYDVNPEEFSKLKCIADATGGAAVRATAAGELANAFHGFAEKIVDDAVRRATGQLQIAVVDKAGAEIRPDVFEKPPTVVVAGPHDQRLLTLSAIHEPVSLLSGGYRVSLDGAGAVSEAQADVVPQRTTKVNLVLANGTLSAVFRPTPGAQPFASEATTWHVVSSTDATTTATANPTNFDLTPGSYRAEASFGPFVATTEVRLRPNGNTAIDLTPRLAELSVAIQQPASDFFAGGQIPHRFRVEVDTPTGPYELGRSSDAVTLQVPPGPVRLPWTTGAESGVEVVEVPPQGLRHIIDLSLPTIAWTLTWNGDDIPDPIEWKIEALLDGKPTGAQEERTGPTVSGTIPAGDYHVTVSRGQVEMSKTVTVPVHGASSETFELDAPR